MAAIQKYFLTGNARVYWVLMGCGGVLRIFILQVGGSVLESLPYRAVCAERKKRTTEIEQPKYESE
jgi:hypothetical protein